MAADDGKYPKFVIECTYCGLIAVGFHVEYPLTHAVNI